MKEVIEQMLKVEAEAKAVVRKAEKQAAEVLEKARHEAGEKAEAVRAGAQEEAARLVEDARRKLETERAEKLKAIDAENFNYAETIRINIPQAVDRVVKRVIGE